MDNELYNIYLDFRYFFGLCYRFFIRMIYRISYFFRANKVIKNNINVHYCSNEKVQNILNSSLILQGGKVKLIALNSIFAHNENNFNILYLISSALPARAPELVRYAKREKIKVVLNQNGVAFPSWAGKNYERINSRLREIYALSDHIIFQSNFCKISAETWLGACNVKSSILYNPVDINLFERRKYKLDGICKLLVCGTHQDYNRLILPIKVLRLLLDNGIKSTLTIAGIIHVNIKNIKKLIKFEGLEHLVSFTPEYLQKDAHKIYNSHDILLHLKHNDASPTVPLEAMSCGVPVVTTDSGGMSELIDNKTGSIVKTGSSWYEIPNIRIEDVKVAIDVVLKNYEIFSDNARNAVTEKFKSKIWLDQHKKIFNELIK